MATVNFQEFYKNVYNPDWTGWNDVKQVESTMAKNVTYADDWLKHSIMMLNNYLLEIYVKKLLNLNFYTNDHEIWREGFGYDVPDYIDENNLTYEIKQVSEQKWIETIPEYKWHKANVRLIYIRNEHALYQIKDKELIKITDMKPKFVLWNEVYVNEQKIQTSKRENSKQL